MTDTLRLEAGMLLKCSHCGEWHTVRPADGNVGESEHALAMLYWLCRGRRFYAGQRGAVPRMPIRRPRGPEALPGLGEDHGVVDGRGS